MSYKLVFKRKAKKEWDKLDPFIRSILKKRLKERLINPRIKSAELSDMKDCYKIKLRNSGYRLVYQVRDLEVVVSVVAIGRRDKNIIYKISSGRI